MYPKKIVIYSLLVMASDCFSLKPNHICLNTNGDHCEKYSCGGRHCSFDQRSCFLFIKYSESYQRLQRCLHQSSGFTSRHLMDRNSLHYEEYLDGMRECSWLATDVCLNQNKCDLNESLSVKFGTGLWLTNDYFIVLNAVKESYGLDAKKSIVQTAKGLVML